jgi:hypothetical protein
LRDWYGYCFLASSVPKPKVSHRLTISKLNQTIRSLKEALSSMVRRASLRQAAKYRFVRDEPIARMKHTVGFF